MKTLVLFISFLLVISTGQAQKETTGTDKVMTAEDGNLSVSVQKDGKCYFIYQNGMSTKKDERNIIFKNKQDFRSFEKKIARRCLQKMAHLISLHINHIKFAC